MSITMRDFFNFFSALVFIANHVLSAIALSYGLNWYDTGQWHSDEWMFMGMGGLICGCLALLLEITLYSKRALWPTKPFPFLCRCILMAILWIALSFIIGSYLVLLAIPESSAPQLQIQLLLILAVPLMTIFYLLFIVPFGVIVGLANGSIVRLTRAFH